MAKFFNKFKKPYFCPFLAHFPYFLDKNLKISKNLAVTHSNTWVPSTMLNFRKKLMSQSQENFQTKGQKDGRTEGRRRSFIGPFRPRPGVQNETEFLYLPHCIKPSNKTSFQTFKWSKRY